MPKLLLHSSAPLQSNAATNRLAAAPCWTSDAPPKLTVPVKVPAMTTRPGAVAVRHMTEPPVAPGKPLLHVAVQAGAPLLEVLEVLLVDALEVPLLEVLLVDALEVPLVEVLDVLLVDALEVPLVEVLDVLLVDALEVLALLLLDELEALDELDEEPLDDELHEAPKVPPMITAPTATTWPRFMRRRYHETSTPDAGGAADLAMPTWREWGAGGPAADHFADCAASTRESHRPIGVRLATSAAVTR